MTARRCIAKGLAAALVLLLAPVLAGAASQPSPPPPLPTVWVLSTGGTIAGKGTSSTDLSNYQSGSIRGDDLVASVPEIAKVATIKVEQIANVGSSDITVAHWLTLANRINQILASDATVAGVVVTHGTNTLEETAYFLNLTVHSDRPVVLVGSMRPSTAISADGPLNLLNAVRTAVAPDARGKGTLVVLNDEINGARDVTKTNTYRVETFKAPELGLLGYVDEDGVLFYRASTRRHTARSEFDVSSRRELPKVAIVSSYVDSDPAIIDAVIASGAKGIVLAGTGAGSISKAEQAVVARLASLPADRRPVIVRSSRVGNGRVIARAEYDALNMVPSDTLSPQKARILLMLALTKTTDANAIRRMFAEY